MENSLKLIKVVDVEVKKTNEVGRNYIRVSFNGVFNEDFKGDYEHEVNENVIKCSMSTEQWNDLKNYMKLSTENNKIVTKNTILLKFDTLGKTKSKNPKLLIKPETYKGYNYWELNVGLLIQNGIVQKGIIKKDFSDLF